MIFRTGVIVLLSIFCFGGCSTTKPVVWKADDFSASDFKTLEIQPVANATGKRIDKEYLSFLTNQLQEQLESRKLPVSRNPQMEKSVLVVASEIRVYDDDIVITRRPSYQSVMDVSGSSGTYIAGASRKALCTVRTRLIEKTTDKVVAQISTTNEAPAGIIGSDNYQWFMKKIAEKVAKEVSVLLQP